MALIENNERSIGREVPLVEPKRESTFGTLLEDRRIKLTEFAEHSKLIALSRLTERFPEVYVWDESKNPGGSQKDRLGRGFQKFFERLCSTTHPEYEEHPPDAVLVTHGAAAEAVQRYNPNVPVKAIVSSRMKKKRCVRLEEVLAPSGGRVYPYDLGAEQLSTAKKFEITGTKEGIDLDTLDLSYGYRPMYRDIINELDPDGIVVGFGTGNCFKGGLDHLSVKKVLADRHHVPFKPVSVIGVVPNRLDSRARALVAPFRSDPDPMKYLGDRISLLRDVAAVCGSYTGVYPVHNDRRFKEAAETLRANSRIRPTSPSGAASVAWFAENYSHLDPTKRWVLINTGESLALAS